MKILLIFIALLFPEYVMAQSKDELFTRDSAKLVVELKEMRKQDQRHRGRKNNIETDNRNTARMLSIINTYGYPSPSRFRFSGNAGVILVHANPSTLTH